MTNKTIAAALLMATAGLVPTPASAYQIDCAILLCLSGGWPASAPCAAARAEFIRRITPWPVEPPLQIWRCPMSASYGDDKAMTLDRYWDVLVDQESIPLQSIPRSDLDSIAPEPSVVRITGSDAGPLPEGFALELAQGADIDISDPAFDFIRSIRVFMVRASQREGGSEGNEECRRGENVRLGSYGPQGEFSWAPSTVEAVPPQFQGLDRYGDHCPSISLRAVYVEWRDFEGRHGWERVDY